MPIHYFGNKFSKIPSVGGFPQLAIFEIFPLTFNIWDLKFRNLAK